tara:strand:+ start:229 stop:1803 length:1575 start_codon:yes stop_codon:yes gene_type:complete
MGIPSYFTHIIKNYSSIIKNIESKKHVNNLFIDCNSIIYDCIRLIEENPDNYSDTSINTLAQCIINAIESHIYTINPSDMTYIAFDGVAPLAKLEQQRTRRYKSNFMSRCSTIKNSIWDTTAITPGTSFMNELNELLLRNFPYHKHKCSIKFSTTATIGEGEHKIFDYIRYKSQKDMSFSNTTNIIYGLDADLFMISLANLQFNKNLYLYRETPHFIKTIDSSLDPNKSYLIDIPELANSINNNFDNNKNVNRTIDYVFLCFLLGNDFLPHFPALNIRTNGINYIINTYKHIIKNNNIISNNTIQWHLIHKLIKELSINENEYINIEYSIRDKQYNNYTKNCANNLQNVDDTITNIPITDREVEHYINPKESGWEERYYNKLFGIEYSTQRIKEICTNYLEGLEWTFKYYTCGCPDWKWKYNYNYPPLLTDLIKYIPYFETIFIEKNYHTAVDPCVQLAYVLPREKLKYVPKAIVNELLTTYNHWYPCEYDFEWSYCRYFWECHIKLPEINVATLEKLVQQHKN